MEWLQKQNVEEIAGWSKLLQFFFSNDDVCLLRPDLTLFHFLSFRRYEQRVHNQNHLVGFYATVRHYFGIYKIVHDSMDKTKSWVDKRDVKKYEELKNKPVDVNEGQAMELFTKRLQKSKLKEMEKELQDAKTAGLD